MISTADEHPPGRVRLLLGRLTARIADQPWSTLSIVAFVSLVCVAIAARFLEFVDRPYVATAPQPDAQQRWQKYVEQFGEPSDAVIVVEADDSRRVRAVIDDLDETLGASPGRFSSVVARFDLRPLREKSLQFLTPDQLESIHGELAFYAPVLDGHWDRAGLESYCRRISSMLRPVSAEQTSTAAIPLESRLERARLLAASLGGYLVSSGAKFTSPWPRLLPPVDPNETDRFAVRYQTANDGRTGFVKVTLPRAATNAAQTSRTLTELRRLLDETSRSHPGVSLGLTGLPVLKSEESSHSRRGLLLAMLIFVAGVSVVLLLGFRGVRLPLCALLTAAVGGSWTLGFATLAVGQLDPVSTAVVILLAGIAISFAVFPLFRYFEQRQAHRSITESLTKSTGSAGTGPVAGAVCLMLAFGFAPLTGFQSTAELGLIAAGGILLCLAAGLVVIPALIAVSDRNPEGNSVSSLPSASLLLVLPQRWPGIVAGVSTLLVVIVSLQGLTWHAGRIQPRTLFDSNLLRLSGLAPESVELHERLLLEPDISPYYAVSLAGSPQQARRRGEQFLSLPAVLRVDDLAASLPRYPVTETGLLTQAIHTRLDSLSSLPREFPQMDPLAIGQALEELYLLVRDRPEPAAREAAASLDCFLNGLNELEISRQLEFLSGYQYDMLAALHGQFQALAAMSDPQPLSAEDVPHELRSRFVSEAGTWLVRIHPREDLRDGAALAQFVAAVRKVDPQATGVPIQAHDTALRIEQGCRNAVWYVLVCVWLVLLVDSLKFGPAVISLLTPLLVVGFTIYTVKGDSNWLDPRLLVAIYVVVASLVAVVFDGVGVRNALLTLAPSIGALLLTAGMLPLLRIDLEPVNVLGLPLILGMGANWGLQVVHDYRAHSGAYRMTSATFNGVLLSSALAIIGFASLLVFRHESVGSLAKVLLVGAASCLLLTLVTLPALFTLLQSGRTALPFDQRSADQQQRHDRRGPISVRSGEIPISNN